MRSLYSLILFSTISAGLFAQPTIDESNFITAGDVFEYTQYLNAASADLEIIPEGGEGLVWDFSDLVGQFNATSDFYFPLDSTPEIFNVFFGTPFISGQNFSTHALRLDGLDLELPMPVQFEEAYQFYRTDSEGYFITGNAAEVEGLPLISTYDTLDVVYSFPLSFGDQDTNSFYFLTEVPTLGTIGQSGVRANNADAWGELILPNASYDCLRVRTELDVTDTLYIGLLETGELIERPQQVIYTWISPDVGGIAAEAVFIGGVPVSFRYITNQSALNVAELSPSDFKLYPNPATAEMNVSVPQGFSGDYMLLDITGREVKSGRLTSTTSVDISLLPEGVYLVSISWSGTAVTKRLIVNR